MKQEEVIQLIDLNIKPNAKGDITAKVLNNVLKEVTNASVPLGETAETAYAGDKGKANADNITALLNSKQDTLVSGSNISTINGEDITKGGNIEIKSGGITKDDNTVFDVIPEDPYTPEQEELLKGEILNDITTDLDKSGSMYGSGEIFHFIRNIATGMCSHAEGIGNKATGHCAHVEGGDYDTQGGHGTLKRNTASGHASHAEGGGTTASNINSHAEGSWTTASGYVSHAEGYQTTASGDYGSHAEGYYTTASGYYSHAEGYYTTAENYAQHSLGQYNTKEQTPSPEKYDATKTLFSIGNGTLKDKRSDALKMLGNGKLWIAGVGTFTGTNAEETNNLLAILNNVQSTLIDFEERITALEPPVEYYLKAETSPYLADAMKSLKAAGIIKRNKGITKLEYDDNYMYYGLLSSTSEDGVVLNGSLDIVEGDLWQRLSQAGYAKYMDGYACNTYLYDLETHLWISRSMATSRYGSSFNSTEKYLVIFNDHPTPSWTKLDNYLKTI